MQAIFSLLLLANAIQGQYNGQGNVGGLTREKTLIYLLNGEKKIINNNNEGLQLDEFKPQKPEVFFLKYNVPTEVAHSKIKYETVDSIPGYENGAIDGVPNRVRHVETFHDEPSSPHQSQIAQDIYRALQVGGIEGGIHAADQLIRNRK